MIVGASHTHGVLNATERRLLENVIDFSEREVAEIMTPRVDMVCLLVNKSIAENLAIVRGEQHTRYPLAEGSADNVIGMIHIKDFITLTVDGASVERTGSVLQSIKRPVLFVPESASIDAVLRTMQATRTLMAIVVDEYGGVAGLLSIEDVIEQIVGDIEDEYDFDEAEDNIVLEKPGRYRVKALTEIADFNAVLGTTFGDTEFDTVGGLVINRFGRLPKRGEQIRIEDLLVRILRADSRRLHLLEVERVADAIGIESPR